MIDGFLRIAGTRIYVPTPNPEWKVRGTVTFKILDKFVEVPYSLGSFVPYRKKCTWCLVKEGIHDIDAPESAKRFAKKIGQNLHLCDSCHEFVRRFGKNIPINASTGGVLTYYGAWRNTLYDRK